MIRGELNKHSALPGTSRAAFFHNKAPRGTRGRSFIHCMRRTFYFCFFQ